MINKFISSALKSAALTLLTISLGNLPILTPVLAINAGAGSPAPSPIPKATDLKFQVSGRDLIVSGPDMNEKTFSIKPSGSLHYANNILELRTIADGSLQGILPGTRAAIHDETILPEVIVKSSVHMKTAAGDPLFENKDFVVNYTTSKIKMAPASGNTLDKVTTDYNLWVNRIDTLVADKNGSLQILEGIPSRSAPVPPVIPAEHIALANILNRAGNKPLSQEDIMPITGRPTPSSFIQDQNNKAMAPVLEKLKSGKPVSIIFWGDSITSGYDAIPIEKGFPNLVMDKLKSHYPNVVISYVQGGHPARRLRDDISQLQELLKSKPDLVIIEYINDLATSLNELRLTYDNLIDFCKASQSHLMFCTPNYPSPSMAKATEWDEIADKPYITMLRQMARANDIALADVTWRWENLSKEGLRPDLMLVNYLNHPNNRGHEIYAEEILRALSIN